MPDGSADELVERGRVGGDGVSFPAHVAPGDGAMVGIGPSGGSLRGEGETATGVHEVEVLGPDAASQGIEGAGLILMEGHLDETSILVIGIGAATNIEVGYQRDHCVCLAGN